MSESASPLFARACGPLSGTVVPPGDKSVSHRALMLGALTVGRTSIAGLLEAGDVLATARAMRALGAHVVRDETGNWQVDGVGVGGLAEPEDVLDLGNAGTGARLLMGLLATHPLHAVVTGDGSLRKRPMGRVTDPLSRFGAVFSGRYGGFLPIAVRGATDPVPVIYRSPVASAQVKSAVLLAALNTAGRSTLIEPTPTRDHSERLLRAFGARIEIVDTEEGLAISVDGEAELTPCAVEVPGDPSSAAFPLVAAAILPDSDLRLDGVGLNPLRSGLFDTLREMGVELLIENAREIAGEPIGDLVVRGGPLTAVDVPPERAPSMIDEYPILAVAAAFANGTSILRGLRELRVKESDRLSAMAEGLTACGVRVEVTQGDDLIVHGTGGAPVPGGAMIETRLDHRIAMSFLVLGLRAAEPVGIDDAAAIGTSFPDFAALMRDLGADIGPDAR